MVNRLSYIIAWLCKVSNLKNVLNSIDKRVEKILRSIDSDLAAYLDQQDIHCQLYGLRWARLLTGREFQSVPENVFNIWDYIFVSATINDSSQHKPSNKTEENQVFSTDAVKNGVEMDKKNAVRDDKNKMELCAVMMHIPAVGAAPVWQNISPSSILYPLQFVMAAMLVSVRSKVIFTIFILIKIRFGKIFFLAIAIMPWDF
jgi:hypothetical protein